MNRQSSPAGYRPFIILLIAWLGLIAPSSLAGAQADDLIAWASAYPTALVQDLPAMALPADAYPVAGLVAGRGRLVLPADEATAHLQVLPLSEQDLLARMRDAGWITRYIGEVGPAIEPPAGVTPTTGWSSVTAYANAVGAMQGFALLDESQGAGVEAVRARQIGDAARLTRYTGTDSAGRPFDRLRYTFVSGPLVGSVALFRGADTPESAMTPEAMVAMAERLLARMGASGDAPGLSALVLHLNPAADLPVDGSNEVYYVLDGQLIPHQGDSAEAIAGAERFDAAYGVDSNFIMHTTFDGQEGVDHQPTWLVALYRVRDADMAAAMVRDHAQLDQAVGYDEMIELDTLPEVGGPIAGTAYTEAWADGSQNTGYRITFAADNTVAIVDISAPGGVSQEVAFALVEAQAACLRFGTCAPLTAPFAPAAPPATPAA